jgi:hypothetical protein
MKRAMLAIIVSAVVGGSSGCCCLKELCCWKRNFLTCGDDCCGDTCCGDGYSGCGDGGCGGCYHDDWHEAAPHNCETCDHHGNWTGPRHARVAPGPRQGPYYMRGEHVEEGPVVAEVPQKRPIRTSGKYRPANRGI